MLRSFILSLVFLSLGAGVLAQKKIIDHRAYDQWKRISSSATSADGQWMAYEIEPLKGDGWLYLLHLETGKKDSFERARRPMFTEDGKALLFGISPGYDTLRNCELNKVKKSKWPKGSLGVYLIAQDSLIKVPEVKSYRVLDESAYWVYQSFENKSAEKKSKTPVKKKKKKKRKKKKKKGKSESDKKKKISSEGKLLVVRDSDFKQVLETKNVTSFHYSKEAQLLAYLTHEKNGVDSSQLHVIKMDGTELTKGKIRYPQISQYVFDEKGKQMALVASLDTIDEGKVSQLLHLNLENNELLVLVDTLSSGFAANQSVSEHRKPYFSLDGKTLFFGVGRRPEKKVKDTLLESEKAQIDLWHWEDDRLQPQQLLELKRDLKKSHLSAYRFDTGTFRVIEQDTLEFYHNSLNPSPYVLAYNRKPYAHTYNWEIPYRRDVYRLNIVSGRTDLIMKSSGASVELSPSGAYYVYFNYADKQLYLAGFGKSNPRCVTCGTKANWLTDLNGMPMPDRPYGVIEWMKPSSGEEETQVMIQSEYNIYLYDIPSGKLSPLTTGKEIEYHITRWHNDSLYFDFREAYVAGFNKKDKSSYLYKPSWNAGRLMLEEKHHSNHRISSVSKIQKGNLVSFRLSSLQNYPDVYRLNWDKKNDLARRVTDVNPQQSEYNWATVELMTYRSYKGDTLSALLYKPEDYDPSMSYPLLVYYYELYSDDIHNHYTPRPTASIIYPTEYASAGYVVLIPDIRYDPGHPAQGAYDCIMGATDEVLRSHPNIDSTRMGLQGQSWGGYQTAQMVTMTKRYRAAMAGAPVSNMFSAYGGIRWGSGLNRQFQYERTQSRIGKTIWEAPELYVENSPLFHLPKVETPLLIMHNDKDGAVPWYQGIELFTGLKRLGKAAWMLNYNGDAHNLRNPANKLDLSIRMRQFFDHYLMGQPAPEWLKNGIPAIDKGKDYHLKLAE
ncbi:MAG: S9 family peptidase [Bacteroidetes bacterium]|nr:MAG: S9 family peptidase [Bacteroidota bacterium]